MKSKVILLMNAGPEVIPAALNAAVEMRHSLRTARTCDEAFQTLNNRFNDVDIIVLDLDPGTHGLALLGTLEIHHINIPVIALTSLHEEYTKSIAIRHGACDCLGKPLTVERLVQTVQCCINNVEQRSPQCTSRSDALIGMPS